MNPQPAEPRTWTLRLPFTRPLTTNQVYGMHWAVRARHVRPWKDAAIVLARHARIPTLHHFTVILHYAPRRGRGPDLDNLQASTKPIVDGLIIARVAPDDSREWYTPSAPVVHGATGEPGRIWLDVIEVQP